MSIIDTLVTDRTPGARYTIEDLNRVYGAMRYLREQLAGIGYDAGTAVPATVWARSDFPTLMRMQECISAVDAQRRALALPQTAPPTPTVSAEKDWLTVSDANDIERILRTVDGQIAGIRQNYFYAAEISAGEV